MSIKKEEKMAGEMVVKSNRIITALQNLSLTEIRLMQLAIFDARETEQGLDVNKPLQISAKRYADTFHVTLNCAYKVLEIAGKSLRARYFTFINENGSKVETNWVQQVTYVKNEACIEIIFTVAVVNEITRLSNHFTKYSLDSISTLQSIYSVRLYELMIEFSSKNSHNNSKKFDYQLLRLQLGIEVDEYPAMGDFKKRVLDLAVSEINKKDTGIKISYKQIKKGRTIVAFDFTVVKDKKTSDSNSNKIRDVNTADMFVTDKLSDKQLIRIARNKQFVADYNHLVSSTSPAGQDTNAWEFEMVNRLKKDPSQFKKRPIREYLDY